uniref:Uncharacterized protein n=1 Tax=Rhizophora mucronata TaxID=61149 RepID=A0A2P2R0G0_RHIMU
MKRYKLLLYYLWYLGISVLIDLRFLNHHGMYFSRLISQCAEGHRSSDTFFR